MTCQDTHDEGTEVHHNAQQSLQFQLGDACKSKAYLVNQGALSDLTTGVGDTTTTSVTFSLASW